MTSTGYHIPRQEGIKLQERGTTQAEEGRFSECCCQPGLGHTRDFKGKLGRALGALNSKQRSIFWGKRKMAPKCVRLLLLLSCVAGPEVLSDLVRPSCASGWFYYKSHCYGYFRKMGNWSHAELECQSYGNGSHLASVLNQKEASVISKYIIGYQRNLPVWIGLHDPQKNQLWRWIDGSTQLYTPWNHKSESGAKHCAALNPKDKFLTWNKNRCSDYQHFLCKYKP